MLDWGPTRNRIGCNSQGFDSSAFLDRINKMNSNDRKSKKLRMPFGTAAGRLRKSLLFKLVKIAGMDTCYRCGEIIQKEGELSIEHKIPWESSANPSKTFFDLDNIAFSHLACNLKHSGLTEEEKAKRQAQYQRAWRKRHPEENKKRRKDKYKRNGT